MRDEPSCTADGSQLNTPNETTIPPALATLAARLGAGRQPLYRALAYVLALAVAVSVSLVAVVGCFAADQAARNERLTREISSLDRQLGELKQIKEVLQISLAKMRSIAQLQQGRNWPVLDLGALSRAIPQGLRLVEMGVDGGTLVLRGEASSAARVAALIRNLDEAHFGSVRLVRLEAASAGGNREGAVVFVVDMTRRPVVPEASPAATAAAAAAPSAAPPDDESPGAISVTLIAALLAGCAVLWRYRRGRRAGAVATRECAAGRLLSSLARVDYADPERWPLAVRLFFLAEVLVLALAAAWWIVVLPQIDALREQEQAESRLKDEFVAKTRQLAGRALYSQQLKEVDQGFAARLKLLPGSFDDASLLIELNQSVLGRGLSLRRINPVGEVTIGDSYATQSWAVELTGDFNDLGAFLADVGKLGRLVTFPKYRLSTATRGDSAVLFDATLEVYRELSVDEAAQQRRAALKSATKEAS
ncbi:MAG: Pilus assembly protein PilO [Proteobacteria bacterium]|nr:Pilus assembly protein PilO [Pseudomonadota bacterium]MBS1229274.1 Pilus assembly protein PilO [Pseudomonadota bacterium]